MPRSLNDREKRVGIFSTSTGKVVIVVTSRSVGLIKAKVKMNPLMEVA